MREEEKWKCPWCGQVARVVRESICDARDCECGAVGIGAPAPDWDEVTDEAIGIFNVTTRPESRGYDAELRADIVRSGVEMRPGLRDRDMGHPLAGGYVYTWFRRGAHVGALEVARTEVTSAPALALIAELNAELTAIYPEEGATHFRLEPEEVSGSRGAFLVAFIGGEPVGCGAVRTLDAETAEIKRMYVKPGMRGRGFAARILDLLVSHARRLRVKRIVLETGERQPEALALYGRAGFVRIPLFGEYVDSRLSVCMAKEL